VVVATGHGSVDLAVEAIRLGALDFLEKPLSKDRLIQTLRNTLERLVLQQQVESLLATEVRERFHGFIGKSLSMQAVYRTISAAAPSKATVFITGESGTGKEVCARAIHAESQRRDGPFVALNCAAIPRELIARQMNLDLQSKLLRFLQTGEVKRLGANVERLVDVRFLCATTAIPGRKSKRGVFARICISACT
jgi:DNA-binding NtrC family response regulator